MIKLLNRIMLYSRSLLFYFGYCFLVVIWSGLAVLLYLFPFEWRFKAVVRSWAAVISWWLRITCGIHYQISGLDNVPNEACIIASNHQSPFEAFMLQAVVSPLCTVVKRELLYIPFFGWALAVMKPIAINRSEKKTALGSVLKTGKKRLLNNISVLIFPEGTRMQADNEIKRFTRGAASLAIASGRLVVPVVHNAGEHWPAHKFLKKPGFIQFIIGEPIDPHELDADMITNKTKDWMNAMLKEIAKASN